VLKQLTFNVLVEQAEGAYVAHCLETSLVATSLDQRDAVAKMQKLIVRQVEFALKHNCLPAIFHPAPNEIFEKWTRLKVGSANLDRSQSPVRVDDVGGFCINQAAYAAAC